jgi:hypothetical protein
VPIGVATQRTASLPQEYTGVTTCPSTNVAFAAGVAIEIAGEVESPVNVTIFVAVFPTVSFAVTMIVFVPAWTVIGVIPDRRIVPPNDALQLATSGARQIHVSVSFLPTAYEASSDCVAMNGGVSSTT